MPQSYHVNATTNVHSRTIFKGSQNVRCADLAANFGVSAKTVRKWKNRDAPTDRPSTPHHIVYALSEQQGTLATTIRRASYLPVDEVHDILQTAYPGDKISCSSVYRALRKNGLSKVPHQQRELAKTFKAYDPGYLHVDVTYLPKLDGQKHYLFVAIDRATRIMYHKIYTEKTAENAQLFFDQCLAFFPFGITHILTDNGLEFTNKLIRSKKGTLCQKDSLLDLKCKENNIQHRLTKPATPKTNGMVERANGTIKNNTILIHQYTSLQEMDSDLMHFLAHYLLYRKHSGLLKEIQVKTPFEAVCFWYRQKPGIFKINPEIFKNNILNLMTKITPS